MYLRVMNDVINGWIARFWKGQLSKRESKQLIEELKEKELIFRNEDRLSFDEELPKETEVRFDYPLYLQQLHEKMGVGTDEKVRRISWARYVAAAVILFIGSFTCIWYNSQLINSTILYTNTGVASDSLQLSNDDEVTKRYRLKDGTLISLSAGSTLFYAADYGEDKRSVRLIGKAKFDVAKDTLHPFEVGSSGYVTKALGTSFIVDNQSDFETVSVKLLEGKVVVQSCLSNQFVMEDQYLLPGDELQIDVKNSSFNRRHPRSPVPHAAASIASSKHKSSVEQLDKPIIPLDLHFSDTPLSVVFSKIALEKDIDIVFNVADLRGKYFTGAFHSKEDVDEMLSIICTMNNVRYEHSNQVIEIYSDVNSTVEKDTLHTSILNN